MTNKILRQMKDRVKKNVAGSDFKKTKSKLGKKQVSAKATKTAFQSKVLHMPSQSLTEEKGEVVTSRNLTLKDVLTQLSHYNEVVRKDAVLGIKELALKYPYLVALHLGAILEKVLNLITDGDLAVRQALISLFELIIPQFKLETLSAYFAVIRVYLLAGLTHMYNTVRMTSLTIVELWIDYFPSLLIPIADQLLPTYNIVLQSVAAPTGVPSVSKNAPTPTQKGAPSSSSSSSSSSSGISAKSAVLSNLRKLLRALSAHYHVETGSSAQVLQFGDAVDVSRAVVPTIVWGDLSRNELVMDQDHPVFLDRQAAFFPQTLTTTSSSTSSPITSTSSTAETKSEDNSSSTPSSSSTALVPEIKIGGDSWQFLRVFFNKLFPLLMANWVEIITSPHAASLQPSTSPSQNKSAQLAHCNKSDLPYLEVMDIILQILNMVLELLGNSGKAGKQKDLEKYLVAYFPLAVTSDIALDINVHLCNTFAHFLESSVHNEQQKPLINAMVQFIVQHFQNPDTVQAQSHKLVGLLPVLRKLLTCVPNSTAQQLLQAFTIFDENSHPHSNAKRACVEFLSEILQAHQSKTAVYKPSDKIARTGLLSLPKLLFKLSTQNLPTTQAILKALVLFGKGKSPIYESVQLPMVPFFFSHLKPSSKYPKGAKFFGPFISLPASHQQDALDALYYFPSLAGNMSKALLACCAHEAVSAPIACRALDLAHHHFHRTNVLIATSSGSTTSDNGGNPTSDGQLFDLEQYLAFLVSLQAGFGKKDETSGNKNEGAKGEKRKRKRDEDADVMEVERDGAPINADQEEDKDVRQSNTEDKHRETIIVEKVRDVSEKIAECFRILGASEGAESIMGLINIILESILTEQPTITTLYGLLQIIPSIYDGEKETTWYNTTKEIIFPENLQKLLPSTIKDYVLTIAEMGHLADKTLLASVFKIFVLCPDILVEVLKLFSGLIVGGKKIQLWNVVETVLSLLNANGLEQLLQQNKIRQELLKLVSILKEDKFISENLNTNILNRLQSEIEILYGLN